MPQASIEINGTAASNTNLPISTLVQLSNADVGGETTYNWTLLDIPPGSTAVLSSPTAENPTFTPDKEGTYLVLLVVNQALATEQRDQKVGAVKQLRTLERVPAAQETTEADTTDGWAVSVNAQLRRLDKLAGDAGVVIGVANSALNKGDVVRASSSNVISTGETLPGFSKADAFTFDRMNQLLGVVVGAPDGTNSVGINGLVLVRSHGFLKQLSGTGLTVGQAMYVSDTATVVGTPGTFRRQIGTCTAFSGGPSEFDIYINGMANMPQPTLWHMGAATTPGNTSDNFIFPGFGGAGGTTEVTLPTPVAGKISKMRVIATSGNTGGTGTTITMRKNVSAMGGLDQTLTVTLANTVLSGSDLTNSFTVAAGDLLSCKTKATAGATGFANLVVAVEFMAT